MAPGPIPGGRSPDGLKSIKAGDTLYLRGGVYYEQIKIELKGRKDAPITVRAFSGELPILDGGFREFFDAPASSWDLVIGRLRANFAAPGDIRTSSGHSGISATR